MAKIFVTTGEEGPHYDPYHYTEIEFTRTDGVVVTLHTGLGDWCEVRPAKQKQRRGRREHGDGAHIMFMRLTGMSAHLAMKCWHRIKHPKHCPDCGSTKRSRMSGYPGESFEICGKCEGIISTHFNESAII